MAHDCKVTHVMYCYFYKKKFWRFVYKPMVEIYVRNFLNSCGLFFYPGFPSLNWLNPLVKKTLINQLLQDCLKKIKKITQMFEKRHFQEKLWTRNISFKKTSKLFYNIEPVIINYQLKLQDGVTRFWNLWYTVDIG